MTDDTIPSIDAPLRAWQDARHWTGDMDLAAAGDKLIEALKESHAARLALAERNIALTAELAAVRNAARTLLGSAQ